MAKGDTTPQYYHEGSSNLRPVKPQGPGFENNRVRSGRNSQLCHFPFCPLCDKPKV